jgi:hypothetical protein
MSEELVNKLRQLHQYAADPRSLVEQVQTQAPPKVARSRLPAGTHAGLRWTGCGWCGRSPGCMRWAQLRKLLRNDHVR